MSIETFRRALREEMRLVPLAIRKNWNDVALMAWFRTAQKRNSQLQWTAGDGDLAEEVKRMSNDLFGDSAIW